MNKITLSEKDIKNRYIMPAIELSRWRKEQIIMEFYIRLNALVTDDKIINKGKKATRGKIKKADYLLYHYNNFPIAIVEAKEKCLYIAPCIQQAIDYASILDEPFAYSNNGEGVIEHDMRTGVKRELPLDTFPSVEELWARYCNSHEVTEDVATIVKEPYYYREGINKPRYYQRVAINRTVETVAKNQSKILLVIATNICKTFTASRIIYCLYATKNVKKVFYLSDRNILIDQKIFNDFAHFKDKNIFTKFENRKMNSTYEIFMPIYHQLSREDDLEIFRQFKQYFFDLIIVDECHRGIAGENFRWLNKLKDFSSFMQIGMTTTSMETEVISSRMYFGEPVYTYC